jgi:hypothetical protein
LKITTPQKILVYCLLKENCEAVTQCSIKPLLGVQWKESFVKMKLGMDFNASFITVPIESLVHPLCVIPDSLEPILWGKNYHHYQYLSTVYVCERTEILGDINNIQ